MKHIKLFENKYLGTEYLWLFDYYTKEDEDHSYLLFSDEEDCKNYIIEVINEEREDFEISEGNTYNDSMLTEIKNSIEDDKLISRIKTAIGSIEQNIQFVRYPNVIGTVISYYYEGNPNNCYFSYWNFDDEIKKKSIFSEKEHDGFTFKGELKNVNGKIMVDTFESDVKKYNL